MSSKAPRRATVALALSKSDWEAGIVASLTDRRGPARRVGVAIDVRRCVDVVDLLAAVGGGLVTAVVLDPGFPRVGGDVVARLVSQSVTVIAACPDEAAERLARQFGITTIATVHRDDSARTAESIIELMWARPAVEEVAVELGYERGAGVSAGPAQAGAELASGVAADRSNPPSGRLIAVWGPAGAPGRTSIALAVAHRAAERGLDTMIIDADTRAAGVGDALGLAGEGSGLINAAGMADRGALNIHSLARQARQLAPDWRVLTGISDPERWSEIPPAAAAAVFNCARALVDVVVVDVGAELERDDELLHDQLVPRRDATALAAVTTADTVIAVSGSEPLSLARFMSRLPIVRAAAPEAHMVGVVNRIRASLGATGRESAVRELLAPSRLAELAFIPDDQRSFDAAIRRQQLPTEAEPRSPFSTATARLADELLRKPADMVSGY